MKTINLSNIYMDGELLYRAQMNFNRLQGDIYAPENVFKLDTYKWPGDNEGRTILALVLGAQGVKQKPEYLEKIIEMLPQKINEKGYFGPVLPENCFDEQQLASNSWVLRALIEYYLWKKDENIYNIIQNIVNNLLLPLRGQMHTYPCRPQQRVFEGQASGGIAGKVDNWYLSTDIGCVFIMLDGASHAYEFLKMEELKELLDEMAEKFFTMEFLKISLQTHATLSALRGILRYYELVKNPHLLKMTEKIYELYLKEGITENYGNYNWFNRPTWTEPCAIIDSMMVAVNLWKVTGKHEYLEVAHNIWFNALGYAQRPNGGFGCDDCSGAEHEFVQPKKDIYEAAWCCTMRGGEGLARMMEYGIFQNENEIIFPFYNNYNCLLSDNDGNIVFKQVTKYPIEGKVSIEVVYSQPSGCKRLKFYLPEWAPTESVVLLINDKEITYQYEKGFVVCDTEIHTGMKFEFIFNIPLTVKNVINKNNKQGYHTFRHGYLILGVSDFENVIEIKERDELINLGNGRYQLKDSSHILAPINNLIYMETEEAMNDKRQILFKD